MRILLLIDGTVLEFDLKGAVFFSNVNVQNDLKWTPVGDAEKKLQLTGTDRASALESQAADVLELLDEATVPQAMALTCQLALDCIGSEIFLGGSYFGFSE